jgi:hypothetical protein
MMRRFIGVLAFVAMAGALCGGTAAQPPQPPKPGAEHKRLGYFVGKWNVTGEVKDSPMGPGGKITSADTCEWFEGGFAVICRSDGKTPMGAMKSIGILGYSTEEKVYTYYGMDNSGMSMTTVAKGTVEGNKWTYTDQGTMGGQPFKMRVTITEVSPKEQAFVMEIQGADGKWMPMMESKATKVGS